MRTVNLIRGRTPTEDADIDLQFRVMRDPNNPLPQRLAALAQLTGRRTLDPDEKKSVRIYREQLARVVKERGPTYANGTTWYVGEDGILRETLPL